MLKNRQCLLAAGALLLGLFCDRASSETSGADENLKPRGTDGVLALSDSPDKISTVVAARERARTLHQVYSSTLEVLHDHYFHANRAVLPARAMEDIFTDTHVASRARARWIAVNAKAMSVDHKPADEFEKEAARRIAAGDKAVEKVDGSIYRFAGSIPLQESCVQCHMGTFTVPSKKARFAGLVITIPIERE